ncbi:putative cytochrome P450 [Medicago truncatula]|uniref:Cytochrome P450 family protein n=1 Tax=Medicago truncatula TaxID=3880 RepID=A0A072TY60_MEDTR|nr:alkane hydroxylase MAH1 [Medicago truncatula]KEH22136.1 cytochrome P450 family protein [Medicago truncatula]RHN45156.1 putative cytochrome P450 [Medicago truncatula]
MYVFGIEELFWAVLVFVAIHYWRLNRNTPMTKWPVLGMLPGLLHNVSNIHGYVDLTLKQNGGTFIFEGPWLTNMNILCTSDPMNVQHITSTKFENYGKGNDFREIFEVLGEGIFRSDSHIWKYNRKLLHSIFKQGNFQVFIQKTVEKKICNYLLVFLDHASKNGVQVDLQDIFQRLTFDNICSVVLGFDPKCLSIDLPEIPCERAFTQAEDTLFIRHVKPKLLWKLQNWFQVGEEKQFIKNNKFIDEMLYSEIKSKREMRGEQKVDLLDIIINEVGDGENKIDDKFLRDTSINLLAAGRDTISSGLTWFFWLVATHPLIEAKILEEIKENLPSREHSWKDLGAKGLSKLVYLHGALCEALRLYPPIPFEHKSAQKSDVLPSGHRVESNTMIVYSLYSVGRVEEIWGEDCLEFKPERWISQKGGIVYVPSYKFIAFNAGPRSCLGKDISFIEMKMVAIAILLNYHIQVVEDHPIIPSLSVVLHMKHGLKVNLKKRSI